MSGAGGSASPILAELDEATGTAFLTIHRPPLGVLDIDAFLRLGDALEEAVGASGASIVVLRSASEKAFCAGADVVDHTPEKVREMLEAFHRVALYLSSMEAVSIAAVNGAALGGGFELVLCCDLIVASERAVFGQPEINVGCFPPIATAVLPQRVGRHRAADIILTGRRLSAFEALAMGLVSRVVPPEELEPALAALLTDLQGKSRSVLKVTARALRLSMPGDFRSDLARLERVYLDELMKLDDATEGVLAFIERRKPIWKNR
ncbi:MAG: enoyl-CoA hydratase/isomerase family protein [Acidobacteria bacterium]|nr:enoyl-CoA hydratase/isomerase family protein [Acidobacteriota bacterium]